MHRNDVLHEKVFHFLMLQEINFCFCSQIAALQEDKKALERLTKSKEAALLEAEKILRSALERALIVEEVQNQNYELRRQIEICQARFLTRFCQI